MTAQHTAGAPTTRTRPQAPTRRRPVPEPRGPERGTATGAVLRAARARGTVPAAAALLVLAFCLPGIGGPVMWRDEIASWTASRRDLPDLLAMLHNVDASSGAYYLFLHAWTAVAGDSPALLRLPSALAMAGTAAVVAALAGRQFGRRAALAAGTAFAVLPAVTRFGQEARAYALLCLAVALALVALNRAVRQPDRTRRWVAYAATVTAVGALHLVALVALTGHAVRVLAAPRDQAPRIRRAFAVAVAAGALPLLPLMAVGFGQRQRQIDWIPVPDADLLQAFLPRLFASGPAAVLIAALAIGAVLRRGRPAALYAADAVVPVAVLWVLSHVGDTAYFTPRYLLFTLPAWAVLAGAGLAALRPVHMLVGVTVPALALAATLADTRVQREDRAHESRRTYPTGRPTVWVDYRGAAAVVRDGLRPGDGIVYAGPPDQRLWHIDAGMAYYLRGEPQPRDVLLGAAADTHAELWSSDCADLGACLDAAAAPRLWLVAVALDGRPADPYRGLNPARPGRCEPVTTWSAAPSSTAPR